MLRNRAEALAFRSIKILYSFMWPIPLSWNFRRNSLETTDGCSLINIITWFYGQMFWATCCFNAFGYRHLLPKYPFERVDFILLFDMFAVLSGLQICVAHIFWEKKECVNCFNVILQFERSLHSSKFQFLVPRESMLLHISKQSYETFREPKSGT